MEGSKLNIPFVVITVMIIIIASYNYGAAEAQIISTSCTSSAMSFTPCLNYITGSSANGGSPTAQCCNFVKSMMTDSVECACLIITGNVPLSIPFSRPLAISLPKVCKTGVPLRCQASGVPLPAPGPVIFGPTPAPAAHSPIGQGASKETTPLAESPDEIAAAPNPNPDDQIGPAASPPQAVVTLGPVANPGIRPVVNPNSSSASTPSPPFLLFTLLGLMVILKCN